MSKKKAWKGPRTGGEGSSEGKKSKSGGGGLMMGMRGGMKRVVRGNKGGDGKKGGDDKAVKPWMRALDIALWIAVAALVVYLLARK